MTRKYAGLFALATILNIGLLDVGANAEPTSSPDTSARLNYVERLLTESSAAKRVEGSGNSKALELKADAQVHFDKARQLYDSGDAQAAEAELGEAIRLLTEAARAANGEGKVSEKQTSDYGQRRESVEALAKAHDRIATEKGLDEMNSDLQARVSAELSASDAFAQRPTAAPKKYQGFPEGPSEFGYVDPPHDLSHIRPVREFLMAPAASWDWRTMSGVTSVKNQNPYGTCWAFAACGDLESKVLINELVAYDYSEVNIQACNPTAINCNAGGNAWMSTNYLALLGTVDESCNPYPGGCPTPTCVNPSCAFLKQVTEWKMIPNDVDAIKAAVMTYGPVYTSMYAGIPGFSTYDGTYCLTHTGTEETNHAVLIVGFDDDMCGGNGAWIVKNSWGASWGDNGYFYIQYGHARIGQTSNVITGWKDHNPDMTVYHWDEWGWWSSVGWDGHDYAVVEVMPQPGESSESEPSASVPVSSRPRAS